MFFHSLSQTVPSHKLECSSWLIKDQMILILSRWKPMFCYVTNTTTSQRFNKKSAYTDDQAWSLNTHRSMWRTQDVLIFLWVTAHETMPACHASFRGFMMNKRHRGTVISILFIRFIKAAGRHASDLWISITVKPGARAWASFLRDVQTPWITHFSIDICAR